MEYVGNIHIHSVYSDGGKTIDQIAAMAGQSGLDFILINDHGTLKGLDQQGYHHGVLVLVGMEVNDAANHYLAMDINEEVEYDTDCPQKVIDEVNRQGGFGVIAHPFEKGSPCYNDTYPWTDWNVTGFQGIEIWNFLSQWRDGITGVVKGLWLLLHPVAGLPGPYPEVMALVDRLQQLGERVMLYGGSDAHNCIMRRGLFRFTISPYDVCFNMINVHIVTPIAFSGDAPADLKMVWEALRQGRSWVACDYYKNSRGFVFELRCGRQCWQAGDKVTSQEGMYVYVCTPFPARVALLKNGRVAAISNGTKHIFSQITAGVYRVESYLRRCFKYHPWVFSNSIWIE